MIDFSLGYESGGEHHGLGVGLSNPPDSFTVRGHLEDGTYIEMAYSPKRTCHKLPGKMGYQGRKVACSECGYGLGDSRWHFCPKCGAEICGAEIVDV